MTHRPEFESSDINSQIFGNGSAVLNNALLAVRTSADRGKLLIELPASDDC